MPPARAFLGTAAEQPTNYLTTPDALRGMRNLQTVLATEYGVVFGSSQITGVLDVSDDGNTFLGVGQFGGVTRYFAVQVPEPTTFALLALTAPVLMRRHLRSRRA